MLMPKKKYIVTLSSEERSSLLKLTSKGKAAAYKLNHARILLLADTTGEDGFICFDETSKQLVSEIRRPLPAEPAQTEPPEPVRLLSR